MEECCVCYELMEYPLVSCNHFVCSICLEKILNINAKCPLCKCNFECVLVLKCYANSVSIFKTILLKNLNKYVFSKRFKHLLNFHLNCKLLVREIILNEWMN